MAGRECKNGSGRHRSASNEFASSHHLAALTRIDDTTCVAPTSAAPPRGQVMIFWRARAAPVPPRQSA
jgi:hypothetical protein